MWTGLVVACVNSFIVCVIGLHTSQYGFIPANLFCICINAFNVRAWLNVQKSPSESTTDVAAKWSAALGPALCRKGLTSRSKANSGTANFTPAESDRSVRLAEIYATSNLALDRSEKQPTPEAVESELGDEPAD
jgi:hypothetical protein